MDLTADELVVKTGTWLYANEIVRDVRIARTNFRPGSGDYEDEAEVQEDHYFGLTPEKRGPK
jgi:hypothetical protein